MYTFPHLTTIPHFRQNCHNCFSMHSIFVFIFLLGVLAVFNSPVIAQCNSTVTGCFSGDIINDRTKEGIFNATVIITNPDNGFEQRVTTDQGGRFSIAGLQPGNYVIQAEAVGYITPKSIPRILYATQLNNVVPPFSLEEQRVVNKPDGNPTPPPPLTPTPTPPEGGDLPPMDLNIPRKGRFNESEVRTLPLGSTTLTRTFDELALLVPGVVLPPQAIGNSVGPGVGGGVGTSGQFAVNGLRSRANNFTVDGSDNNDEDIGVRRQGFFSLVPQSIESIQQFSITTLLAPAESGRNLGAQVNAISKAGGNQFHGAIYGLANADFLNARNFFDNAGGDSTSNLQGIRQFDNARIPVFIDNQAARVTNDAGEKDVFSLLQGGFTIGGPIARNKMFFFVSGEGQLLNGSKESHFIVPTVEQRGFVSSATTGLQQCPGQIDINGICRVNGVPTNFTPGFPTSVGGDAVFSLFPFANDPNGIYGRNTYTQSLPTDARGGIFSGKFDYNLSFRGRPQTFTARYNHTDDRRDLTDVGGALFSSIRPLTRTDNLSTFFNGYLTNNTSNELRFSFGRTRLKFEEIKDTSGFLLPVSRTFTNPDDARFLLNARLLFNVTLPTNCTPTGCFAPSSLFNYISGGTTENTDLGLIGQLNVAGFSPIGVDVFNFPQQRVNNTFQIADTLRWQFNQHSFSFGTDIRRTYLNSDLPRNSRPLATFNGSLDIRELCETRRELCPTTDLPQNACIGRFCTGLEFASAGAATGFFQTLVLPGKDARINLSYNQLNFFAQDEWRINQKILLNFGLRYEYNTTPKEADRKIEDTFAQPLPPTVTSLSNFIDGRDKIFDADRNNFAPRFGVAAALTDSTVVRGGFGVYYDQILGAVVSQSRNVFPTFTTLNTGGGNTLNQARTLLNLGLFNPLSGFIGSIPIIQPGTLNTINPAYGQTALLGSLQESSAPFPFFNFNSTGRRIAGSAFGATIPQRKLNTPFSYQYSISIEKRLFQNTFLSVAYVGTQGQDLLRFTTPNLGSNYLVAINNVDINSDPLNFGELIVTGATFDPTANGISSLYAGRPVPLIGPINQFETTGRSRYNSLQIELRGRLSRNFQYQTSYVYGQVKDDVSDVFDLAGAFALPQNSLNFEGEYAPANFDVRHRFTYNFIYDLPEFNDGGSVIKFLLGGWQVAGTGKLNTGQPFTVNSIYDVNLDGNLTDRLNSTQSITQGEDRRRRLMINGNSQPLFLQTLLAPTGQNGAVERNSFRAGGIIDVDLSLAKRFSLMESQYLQFRVDIFNFINRANFGIPVRLLEAPSFGEAVDTITPGRRIQIGVKYIF